MNGRLDLGVERLPPSSSSVAAARRLVRRRLLEAGREELIDSAELLVSEVVTNALVHTGTNIDLAVSVNDDCLRVEVGDESPHLPVRRGYSVTAGTGRGLKMLEDMVDDWGVIPGDEGKTVWFELCGDDDARPARTERRVGSGPWNGAPRMPTVMVELLNVPVLLHAAWHQHAQALLREYLLISIEVSEASAIQVHAQANDALALLAEHIPAPRLGYDPESVMVAAVEPQASTARVKVPVPLASVEHFETLDRTLDMVLELADQGILLTPTTQPEVRELRRWLCRQVRDQAAGAPPTAWVPSKEPVRIPGRGTDIDFDPSSVTPGAGVIVADETNQIRLVNDEALGFLGYDNADELVGHRIVTIVPRRYRQAHLAGFTLHFLTGRDALLGKPVVVPALRRDGTEVTIELTIRARHLPQGRRVFTAELRQP